MMTGAIAALRITLAAALMATASVAHAEGDRVRGCMSPSQAHELLIEQKFVAPFRALREAVRGGQGGDAVGVQLCRLGETFVYDITLLQRDGRVSHTLVNARTGIAMAPVRPAK